MKNNDIEKNIQAAFDNYSPKLNNDEIWDNIEPQLKKKKKRRFLLLWFLLAGLGLGFLFVNKGGEYFSKNENKNSVRKEISQDNSNQVIAQEEICPEDEKLDITNVDTFNPIAGNVNDNTISNNEKRKVIKTRSNDLKVVKTDISTNSSKENIAKEVLSSVEKSPVIITENQDKSAVAKSSETNTNEIASTDELIKDLKTSLKIEEKTPTQKRKKVDKKDKKVKKVKKVKKKEPVRKKKKRKSIWKKHVQLTLAPVLPLKIVNAKSPGLDQSQLIDKRKETESFADAFAIDLNLQFVHKKGWLIQYGLEYMQIDEKFYEKSITIEEETGLGTVGVIEDAQGVVIESIVGERSTRTTTTEELLFFNNHRFISVPVGVGTTWKNKKSLYKFIAGLQYNLYYNFNGTIYSRLQGPESFNGQNPNVTNQIFRNNAGLGLWLAAEYARPINDQLSWVIAPKIYAPFSSVTRPEYAYNQRYFTFNLNLGLSYFLNPKKKKGGKR